MHAGLNFDAGYDQSRLSATRGRTRPDRRTLISPNRPRRIDPSVGRTSPAHHTRDRSTSAELCAAIVLCAVKPREINVSTSPRNTATPRSRQPSAPSFRCTWYFATVKVSKRRLRRDPSVAGAYVEKPKTGALPDAVDSCE